MNWIHESGFNGKSSGSNTSNVRFEPSSTSENISFEIVMLNGLPAVNGCFGNLEFNFGGWLTGSGSIYSVEVMNFSVVVVVVSFSVVLVVVVVVGR